MSKTAEKRIEWNYSRRAVLARDVQSAIYKSTREPQVVTRSFVDEAKRRLPKLYAAVERYNARAHAKRNRDRARAQRRVTPSLLVQKTRQVAMFGTDRECQALADRWLLGPIRAERKA